MLRAIDGIGQSIDCAALSMNLLVAHHCISRSINRLRNTALARSMDGICSRAYM